MGTPERSLDELARRSSFGPPTREDHPLFRPLHPHSTYGLGTQPGSRFLGESASSVVSSGKL
jgi:hypothetical protein